MNSELLKVIENTLDRLTESGNLNDKFVSVFGMNHPGDFIINYLAGKGVFVNAVLDNNPSNLGLKLEGVCVSSPEEALSDFKDNAAILICSRYYAEMRRQLERMGYADGVHIFKLLDMGSGAVFSLDKTVFDQKAEEALKGARLACEILRLFDAKCLFVLPVRANGDVFISCGFLRQYARKNGVSDFALAVVGNACACVAGMFGFKSVAYVASQTEIESLAAACRLLSDSSKINVLQPYWNYASFINRLDCFKGLTFREHYRSWVMGLDAGSVPERPCLSPDISAVSALFESNGLKKGKTVIFSPYANSLSGVPFELFELLAAGLKERGYTAATNIAGDEAPIAGTVPLSAPISDLISIAEYGGAFTGVRNGICDILSASRCVKAVLYPQKACAFGTALDLFSISDVCQSPLLELTVSDTRDTRDTQNTVRKIIDFISESEKA